MKTHDATEQAYKNGYDKGYADGIRDAKNSNYMTSDANTIPVVRSKDSKEAAYFDKQATLAKELIRLFVCCAADIRGEEDGNTV